MGEPGLPLKLKTTLQLRTSRFLFVGFDFNKWYSQLLLRLLSGKDTNIKSFAISAGERPDSTNTFLVGQFGIEFVEDEAAFLEELCNQCEAKGLLREISAAKSDEAIAVIRHIQKGEIKEALVLTEAQAADAETRHVCNQLMAQFSGLQEQQRKGIIDSRDYHKEWNKIVDALLTLTSTVAR
jgi:hypothetical protein